MTEELLIQENGRILTLTINRPEKLNTLVPEVLWKMADTLNALGMSATSRPVVIRGAGEKSFSAGYDIASLPRDVPPEIQEELKSKPPMETAIQAIMNYPYPVIAMIQGYAFGGGCEMAIACDLRVAGEKARMGMPPAKIGLVYPYSGYRRFLNVLGYSRTLEVFLTGRYYDSARCREMGLVNYVVPDQELEKFTYDLAEELADNAPLSLRGTKSILNRIVKYPHLPPEEEEVISSLFTASLQSEDVEEGKRAFREKRKPVFKGC